MGQFYSSATQVQSDHDLLLEKGRSGLHLCVKRTDRITIVEGRQALVLEHYLTFPNLYEGLKLWEGALVLLRHIFRQSAGFIKSGARVLDIGAGMGVVGVALAKFFDCEVTISDYIPEVLDLARKNVNLNTPYKKSKGS